MRSHAAAIATVAVHAGIAAGVATIEREAPRTPTVITVRETARKPEPPPPPRRRPRPRRRRSAPPAPAAKPPPPSRPRRTGRAAAARRAGAAGPRAGPADFGLKLGNSGGGNGRVAAPPPAAPAAPPPPKTLAAKPHAAAGGCSEPIVKPKPLQVVQPAFTQEAQDAGVTGKVRVEITISATGAVTAAKVIAGLGHGLDEAALDAAKRSTFSPATRCGEPVETTFTIGMRFQR